MRNRLRRGRTTLTGVALLCAAILSGEDFNEARLQSGKAAYQAKRYREATDEFRIAVFGYLDQPVLLSECLVRLSLGQAGAGKMSDVDATLNRFLEVERRFGVYGKASLEPETRSAFRALLTQRVPEAIILAVPSLAASTEPPARVSTPARAAAPAAPTAKPAPAVRPAAALRSSPGNRSEKILGGS